MQWTWYYGINFTSNDIPQFTIWWIWQVKCCTWPIKMPTGTITSPLVHTFLHGVGLLITIRWLQLLCTLSLIPPCHVGMMQLSKSCIPTGNMLWICYLFRHSQPLVVRLALRAKQQAHHINSYHDVITGSRESRDPHYNALLIYWILKFLLPQNNTFLIATVSIVKDAAVDPDCQRLREQIGDLYYLRFYLHRTMSPTRLTIIGSDNGLAPGQRQTIIWTNAYWALKKP